ncbi:LuxR C-terminal-related transcriptional regulator [Nonomuraea sp. NPDC046802]|uniref:helix-turn-helix transcriptional regulator n=1 Tax=Nonomuraea sp. NPDC046802 TaxID=3154919 RepID=UPI0033DCC00B
MNDYVIRDVIDRLLPERLQRLQRVSGVPVVFGGTAGREPKAPYFIIKSLIGAYGVSLRGLAVRRGRGLGGTVLQYGVSQRVNDYASTTTITHDYDRIVVEQERLTSVFAVPVIVRGAVQGVVYGAVRDPQPIGDRALRSANVIASQLRRDIEGLLLTGSRGEPAPDATAVAIAELSDIIGSTDDPELRARLIRVRQGLIGRTDAIEVPAVALAPRELDALRLAAVGASNLEVGAQLGLSPETVKAYMRTAMRKLNVHNRMAAVHAARLAGML